MFILRMTREVRNVYKTGHSENLSVGRRMGHRDIECEVADWIVVTRVRDQRLADVIMVMDLWVP